MWDPGTWQVRNLRARSAGWEFGGNLISSSESPQAGKGRFYAVAFRIQSFKSAVPTRLPSLKLDTSVLFVSVSLDNQPVEISVWHFHVLYMLICIKSCVASQLLSCLFLDVTALAILELTPQTSLALNSLRSTCCCLLSTRIKDVHHHCRELVSF